MKNPDWTRDELMLALDLYFRFPASKLGKDSDEIVALSGVLRGLPIHPENQRDAKFRNPNGVSMKIMNFRRLDPGYSGKGLSAGNDLEIEVWNRYINDRKALSDLCKTIKELACEVVSPIEEIDLNEEADEGQILFKLHKTRERKPSLARKKKKQVIKKNGKLVCEVCRLNFENEYGGIGNAAAECHHTKPLALMKKGDKTKLSDLSILCANCHRVIHRTKPMPSVEQLRDAYIANKSNR